MICNFDSRGFNKELLRWWTINRRDFPWRRTKNAYEILIAEVLLHRTRAEQVVPVFLRFIDLFPNISALSEASLQQVKSVVQELGLHWRTESLHDMSHEIITRYEGRIPQEKDKLKSLPGISDYIASAFRCFALNIAEPLLDTNTVRILSRVFETKMTDASRRSSRFAKLYKALNPEENPRELAFALIDLGALVCISKDPLCDACPVRKFCLFGLSRIGGEYERKTCCRAC